jgi:hypothetical protein
MQMWTQGRSPNPAQDRSGSVRIEASQWNGVVGTTIRGPSSVSLGDQRTLAARCIADRRSEWFGSQAEINDLAQLKPVHVHEKFKQV